MNKGVQTASREPEKAQRRLCFEAGARPEFRFSQGDLGDSASSLQRYRSASLRTRSRSKKRNRGPQLGLWDSPRWVAQPARGPSSHCPPVCLKPPSSVPGPADKDLNIVDDKWALGAPVKMCGGQVALAMSLLRN